MTFTIKQKPAILEGTVFCHEHECPLVTVVGDGETHYMCLFEALDELIGQEGVSRAHISEEG